MKAVVYTDQDGWLRRTLIPDEESEENAKYGLPAGPPDLEQIDWEMVKKEINNTLVEREIVDWMQLQQHKGLPIIAAIVKRHVAALFKQEARLKKGTMREQSLDL